MTHRISRSKASLLGVAAATLFVCAMPRYALAQDEGGLYVAEGRLSFEQAAEQGLAGNPGGQRFFLLTLPPNTVALTKAAPKSAVALRNRVVAAGGVLLVCQRDIDNGSIDPAKLVPGVVAVRGFAAQGGGTLPRGERYFPGENRDALPANNVTLQRLRTTCS